MVKNIREECITTGSHICSDTATKPHPTSVDCFFRYWVFLEKKKGKREREIANRMAFLLTANIGCRWKPLLKESVCYVGPCIRKPNKLFSISVHPLNEVGAKLIHLAHH